jgi:DNA-binding LacI/PurR family transcriptional regulator
MGQLAGETLFNLLAGTRPADIRRLPTELIVRESTAPPPKAPRSASGIQGTGSGF